MRTKKPLEIRVHLEIGQADFPDMPGQGRIDRRTAGDQSHIMIRQCATNFKAAEKMPDSQHMLAVVEYLHISRFQCIISYSFSGKWLRGRLKPGGKIRFSSSKRRLICMKLRALVR